MCCFDLCVRCEGNRIASHTSSLHVTNQSNRLTEDEHYIYAFSAAGNMTRKTDKATGVQLRMGYNDLDQLGSISEYPSSTATSYTWRKTFRYDAFGRRWRTWTRQGSNWDFLYPAYNGWNVSRYRLASGILQNQNIRRRWVTHGAGIDDLLAITPHASGNNNAPGTASYYYHTDHQGSVRALTDDAGQVVNEYDYDTYGNLLTSTEGIAQPFRYTGQQYDGLSQLYYYRYRNYDAATGRFLQEDPLWFEAGDLNTYRYVFNNPVARRDPLGLASAVGDAATRGALLGVAVTGGRVVIGGISYAAFRRTIEVIGTAGAAYITACLFNRVATGYGSVIQKETNIQLIDMCNAGGTPQSNQMAPSSSDDSGRRRNNTNKSVAAAPPGGGGPFGRCMKAANGSQDDWLDFCNSVPSNELANVTGEYFARSQCRDRASQSSISKQNWCYNQFGGD